jgi:hypothetical protein
MSVFARIFALSRQTLIAGGVTNSTNDVGALAVHPIGPADSTIRLSLPYSKRKTFAVWNTPHSRSSSAALFRLLLLSLIRIVLAQPLVFPLLLLLKLLSFLILLLLELLLLLLVLLVRLPT